MKVFRAIRGARDRTGLIFLHIPKTGGSSIAGALRRHYRFSNFHIKSGPSARAATEGIRPSDEGEELDERIQVLRRDLILYAAHSGKRFLTGHVWYDPAFSKLASQDYLIATCLREPVSRWFSAYFYDRFKTSGHARIEEDIEEFLHSERARTMGATYVRYIGGLREDGDYRSMKAVEDAMERFTSIDILGTLDNLDQFRARFLEKLGIRLTLRHRRRSPADREMIMRVKGTPEFLRAVEVLCEPDVQLYRHALAAMSR